MLSGLSLAFLALGSWVFWQLLSFVRARIATAHLRRIPGPPAGSFLAGNLSQFFARDAVGFQTHIAHDFGSVVKLDGFFGTPILYVADPKALHTILIKEEHIFHEVPDFISTNTIIFGANALVSTLGAQHSRQRKLLNPVFSVSHMRHMLPLFYNVVYKLRAAIESRVGEDQREIDMLNWMGRTALELIGQGGLGHSLDPLIEDSTNAYGQALKSIAPGISELRVLRQVTIYTRHIIPAWVRRAVVDVFPRGTTVHAVKEMVDTMDFHSRAIYDAKKLAFQKGDAEVVKQVAEGKDIMRSSVRLHPSLYVLNKSKYLQVRANSLADAADRLSEEEVIQQMSYPPVTILFRVATQDTVLPLSEPIYATDGTRMDDIPLMKGSQVILGFFGCNTSKALWGEDAHEWKPERWLSPLPSSVTDARIPGVYSNLGFKFSEMEMSEFNLRSSATIAIADTRRRGRALRPPDSVHLRTPEKPIVWNVAGVWYPTAEKDSARPEMPLKFVTIQSN
ncbi:cytochrome P450 [Fomitopsis serialis]|uniref:cytochrome P450 n=1 Tax=Fomitopsis serialis TaxID=139415 RepID=UPI002007C063|nr:cytochrome P450 [Neoantrodia serialis]KAH9936147.1 cytochrome P450 [Neoantrodia serialis]